MNFEEVLSHLRHYLPTQAPLKDFIHHNTLHAFQHEEFHHAIHKAARMFGYQVYLTLDDYRERYNIGDIHEDELNRAISRIKGETDKEVWRKRLLHESFSEVHSSRVGQLRNHWKTTYHVNMDKYEHPLLFRLVGSFLDQGISISGFPYHQRTFLNALRSLERSSYTSIFRTHRARTLLLKDDNLLETLISILLGDERLLEHYLFDQQFAHPGWSGMVAVLEENPAMLLDKRRISLHDFIVVELLLELDVLDLRLGNNWNSLSQHLNVHEFEHLFITPESELLFDLYRIWQEAFEWSFYNSVLKGLQQFVDSPANDFVSFQAVFCIDDRECSLRRYIETNDNHAATFGTAGFFNVPFYFQPEHGRFYTKSCPAPQNPTHLIKEYESKKRHKSESHFSSRTYSMLGGMIAAPAMGIWSALKMGVNILFPADSPARVSSFTHMDRNGKLSIEHQGKFSKHLQVGFTIDEMTERVEGLLKAIGLVNNFAPIVYFIGHGASSVNNTHYAGYDCGACSGRSGSVNARVIASMANNLDVRKMLSEKGWNIPNNTQFIGGIHDTTCDEIEFFDEANLSGDNRILHERNKQTFHKALLQNAKERSRRFLLIDSSKEPAKLHKKVKLRSMSLFEPRPEWNHATNALCIIGRRDHNKHLFMDRRAFLNSYDYRVDTDGSILLGILNAIAPVCGGINLEYYFSRVDNCRLGAGTKLPHNVMGLIGVANGMDGDLRPGLPFQMINIHDPLRLLVVIEHKPEQVLPVLKKNPVTFEWFHMNWIHLVVLHPETKDLYLFDKDHFIAFASNSKIPDSISSHQDYLSASSQNLPILQLL